MRILFSVFTEDRETGNIEIITSVWVQTNWTAQQIDQHIGLFDGFRSNIVIGEHLSFFDYYCFFADVGALIQKIKSIPNHDKHDNHTHTPSVFRVHKFNPGNTDTPQYPSNSSCFLYNLERYECGVSGFTAIACWASAHPLEMMFIGGLVYDFSKWAISRVLRCFRLKTATTDTRPLVLNTKKLYRNFSKATGICVDDCQITKFHRLRAGVFHVAIRTSEDKKYKLKCNANGTVESLEEITLKTNDKC